MTTRRSALRRRRTILLLAVPAAGLALAAALAAVQVVERIWNGHPYPVAAPAATAHRLDGHTRAVYDALGLPHAELADYGTGWDADVDDCPRRGLRHLPDGLMDSGAPSAPHTVKITDSLALQGIPRAQAAPALQRVRNTLAQQGWKVVSYVHSADDLQLRLHAPESDDTITVEAGTDGRLQITTFSACARYPAGTPMNDLGRPKLPDLKAPVLPRG